MPACRVNATGRVMVSCWQASSSRLPNGSSNPTNDRTRRDRAAAASPRTTAKPARSSSVSAAANASSSATTNPDEMTPERPSTSARQWCRPSARRCAVRSPVLPPPSAGPASSSPTISVANVTALPRSVTPERTYAMSVSSIMKRSLRVERREVDVDLPVAHEVAVEGEDVGVGYGHRLAVLAAVLHVDLAHRDVADVPQVEDVVGQAVDAREEAGDGVAYGGATDGGVPVAAPENDVPRELGARPVPV